jgi:hypothetical protein
VFRAFTIKYTEITNRITSQVEVCEAFDPKKPPSPVPTRLKVDALWDTGASRSVLTPDTVKALGLKATGTVIAKHGGGTSDKAPTHVINVFLPNGVGVVGVLACELPDLKDRFGFIVGMDIIAQGDFAITNLGRKTCVSFRIPSIAQVDYVEESKRTTAGGLLVPVVGRNDRCPCGSKKKYKKCHGSWTATCVYAHLRMVRCFNFISSVYFAGMSRRRWGVREMNIKVNITSPRSPMRGV